MLSDYKKQLRLEVIVRVIADIALLNISIACGLLVRLLFVHDAWNAPSAVLAFFLQASMFLSTVGPIIFASMGFYTKGRFYAGRYKAVAIFQATALLFLVFGFANYLVSSHELSRLVTVATWAFATALIEAARFWAWIWHFVAEIESAQPEPTYASTPGKVLLIGGAGYIGSSLLRRLLLQGYQVRLLDAFIYGEEPIAD